MTPPRRVAGIDGCRGGWVLAITGTRPRTRTEVRVVERFADVMAMVDDGTLAAVGVDMPIGLPERGDRTCDVEARRRLGPRRSSVFPTPVRALLEHADSYRDACDLAVTLTGKGLSKQSFHLLPKIAEVDRAMTVERQAHVFECHPESCFVSLAGRPLTTTKRSSVGLAERAALLHPHFPDLTLPGHESEPGNRRHDRPAGSRADDVLDALVVAWAARRWLRGQALVLGDGATDRRGLRMEIIG